jgi:hypothetical protein
MVISHSHWLEFKEGQIGLFLLISLPANNPIAYGSFLTQMRFSTACIALLAVPSTNAGILNAIRGLANQGFNQTDAAVREMTRL